MIFKGSKVPDSVINWIDNQLKGMEYGSVTVHFVLHQGQVKEIIKATEERGR